MALIPGLILTLTPAAAAAALPVESAVAPARGPQSAAPQEPEAQQQQSELADIEVVLIDINGDPVVAQPVVALGPSRQVVREGETDENGRVILAGLRHGSYELRVLSVIFTDVYRVIEAHQPRILVELTLRPTGVEERVTVTAARGALQAESEIPATVRSLDEARLQARAVDLLPRMLDEEPGILTQQTTPGQGSPILRGQSAQAVLYLVDGVRYNNATYRAGNTQYLAWVPDSNVDSVEALLGPAGVNYGSDALGGAVNVITRPAPGFSPATTRITGSVRVFGEAASTGGGANGSIGFAAPNWAGYVTASAARHGDVRGGRARDSHHATVRFLGFDDDQVRDAFGNRYVDTGYGRAAVTAKASFRTGSTSSIDAYLARSEQYDVRRYDRLLGGDGRVRADFDPQELTFGYLRYQQFFSDSVLEATLSLNRQTDGRIDQRRPTSALQRERNSDTVVGLEVTGSRTLRRHLLSGGVEFYADSVDASRSEVSDGVVAAVRPRVPDGARYRSLGLFLLDEWNTLDGRLRLSGGLRYSRFRYMASAADNVVGGASVVPDTDLSFDDLTFNFGVHYALNDTLGAWGRVARGFRAPSIFDLGELGLTGGGFEIGPDEAVGFDALIGESAARNAVSSGVRWSPLAPEVLWSYEAGLRWFSDDVRIELTGFDSEFVDTISRRVVIIDRPAVGETIGGETIIAQDSAGRIFVAADPDPVVSRANIGRTRVWGIEALFQKSFGSTWLATLKMSMQRGKELDTGFFARKIAPGNMAAILRWRSGSGRLQLEGVVKAAATQDRLNPGDLDDTRIGAFRDAGDIADFFVNQGPRLGLVRDGILLATGETLDQVISRVLGASGAGAPLFTRTPSWVTLGIRGTWSLADNQSLSFGLHNMTDANYRLHGSGFDALGINVTVAYSVDF